MENRINNSRDIFEENFKVAKKAFVLNTNLEASACAASFIGSPRPVSAEAMKAAKKVLDDNASLLSSIRTGNCRQIIVATLAQSSDPEYAVKQIKKIHKGLDRKFLNSSYLVLAATMIYRSCREADYDRYISRTREIYKLIRKDHPLATGAEDIISCVIMALTDVECDIVARNAEDAFTALKKYFFGSEKIQYMANMAAVFGGDPDDKAKVIRNTYEMLKSEGVRYDSNAYGIIASIGLLVRPEDLKDVVKAIKKTSDDMKSIRGMGAWGAGKRIRNILASAIVLDAYTGGDKNSRSAVINSIITTIIAIEIAAVAAASSAAASSAASS